MDLRPQRKIAERVMEGRELAKLRAELDELRVLVGVRPPGAPLQ